MPWLTRRLTFRQALRNLVFRNPENQTKAAFVGGIEAVVAAMGRHAYDVDVQARNFSVCV